MRAPFTRSLASLAAVVLLLAASPSAAAWEGSRAEDIVAKGLDALLVRPLASVRVVVGALMVAPAMLLAAPGGKEGINGAYDTLLAEPMEYAFKRELGDF